MPTMYQASTCINARDLMISTSLGCAMSMEETVERWQLSCKKVSPRPIDKRRGEERRLCHEGSDDNIWGTS